MHFINLYELCAQLLTGVRPLRHKSINSLFPNDVEAREVMICRKFYCYSFVLLLLVISLDCESL